MANPRIDVAGAARVQATLSGLELGLDRLGGKDATAKVSLDDTGFREKLAADAAAVAGLNDKLGGIPSMLAKIAPALPVLGGLTGAIGLVGASFSGAVVTAGAFGLAAKSVLADASSNLAKLQRLERAVNSARTAAQKKAAQEQVTILEQTWNKGYLDMIEGLKAFKQKWTETSQAVAVPALTVWLRTLTDGMQFLIPLVTPVAAVFRTWGEDLDRYFASAKGSAELTRMAAALGKFGAQQMKDIGSFIGDIAKGVFNLGRNLGADNVNFGTFGQHLNQWGTAFLQWSRSSAARADVNKFLTWMHSNGGLVKTIVADLGKLLPNLFTGLSGAGSLELKAIGGFFTLLTGLPSWMQRWIVEGLPLFVVGSKVLPVIAAAAALVAKTTTLMGLKPAFAAEQAAAPAVGGAAGSAATSAGAGGLGAILASSPAAAAAAGALIAGGIILKVREDLKSGFQGIIKDIPGWFNFGTLGFISESAQGWADLIVSKLRHSFMSWEDDVRHYIAGSWDKTRHDAASAWDGIIGFLSGSWSKLRRDAANVFDGVRHDMASIWGGIAHDVAAKFDSIRHDAASKFDSMRHDIAARFDGIRHDVSSAMATVKNLISSGWDSAYSSVKSIAGNIVSFVAGLPGKFITALHNLPAQLKFMGTAAFTDLLSGMKSIGGSILTWLGNFVSSVLSKIKSLLGIHSPSSAFYDIGKNMMLGLKNGIQDHAHQAADAAIGKAQAKAQSSHSSGGGVSGAGPVGGDAGANKALARKMFPWPASMWGSYDYLEMREAGYNRFARNPGSGAYGIPQALPPTKMPFAAQAGGGSHAGPQLSWMFDYIRQVYGNPVNAAAHERSHNWYAAGGATSAGWAMVGEHGRELVKVPGGATVYPNGATNSMLTAGSSGPVVVQLEITGGQSATEQFLLKMIREQVRVKGGGNVQKAFGRN